MHPSGHGTVAAAQEEFELELKREERKMFRLYFLLIAAVGLFWLYGASYAPPKAPPNLAELPKVDGTLASVSERELVIRPFHPQRGRRRLVLYIRYSDEHNFDLTHMRAHAALGIPTRLFYKRARGRDYAVWKEDSPVNTRGQS